jgi:RNA polymerase sigma factor (TIGR02999 family)
MNTALDPAAVSIARSVGQGMRHRRSLLRTTPRIGPRSNRDAERSRARCIEAVAAASSGSIVAADARAAMQTTESNGPSAGQPADALFVEVYDRLKAMAGNQLVRAHAGETLDTTSLVHDLYVRMSAQRELAFSREEPFFAYAARAMRNLLIDHARQRLTMRMGGDWVRVTLTGSNEEFVLESAEGAIALDDALKRLAEIDTRAAEVVELRYFAGLTLEQIAEVIGLARRTIDRDWRFACAFLQTELA